MSQMLPEIFEAGAETVGQGVEDGSDALATTLEDAAQKEEDSVANEMSAEAKNAEAIKAIGDKAGQDAGDVPDVPGAAGPGAPGETGPGGVAAPGETDPGAASRDLSDVPAEGDPVDMATGDVVLGQTDVALPGTLPLVLERTHRSSYRAGRWFGRSWVSTLDQRLEVTASGVFFARPDGSVLSYPHPDVGGEPVWPVSGARWPLARDEDGYTVSDPQAGTARRFESRSGYYLSPDGLGELPLVSVTSRAGHRIGFEHDQDGAPVSVTHDGGYQVKVEITGGRVASLSLTGAGDGGQDVTLMRYGYDEAGNLAEVINSSQLPQRFSYDYAGRLAGWQDRNGWWYRYSYDRQGRCVRGQGTGGMLSGTFAYDPGRRVSMHTDPAGAVTVYEMTEEHRVAAVTDPLGHTSRSEYDQNGQLISQTDPLGRTTRFSYDRAGNMTTLTRPDGSQATARYNDQNLPVAITEPGGAAWQQEFDARGNLVRAVGPDGSVTRCGYDERGHLAATTDPLGAVTVLECNPAGLPVAVTAPDGATTRYDRDALGRVTAVTAPDGAVTRLTWTTEGQLESRTFPDGTLEQFSYDGEENLVAHRDPGGVTRFEYGYLDQLAARTGRDGTRTEFGYDQTLRLTSVTHAGLTWHYDYDPAGRLTAQTDYNGAATRYAYDAAGQVTARVNAVGQQVGYTYDLLGNPTERHDDSVITTFGYDPSGRFTQAASPDADIVIERDRSGRVIAETCNGRTVRSDYDPAGRRLRRITPSDAETHWAYDECGRPVSLSAAGHELRFGYDPSGRETLRHLPGGAILTQEWDPAGQLAAQVLTAGPRLPTPPQPGLSAGPLPGLARVLQRRNYSYRPDGILAQIDDLLSGPRQLALNRAGQITAVTGPDWAESYGYDRAGNITAAAWPALSDDSQPDAASPAPTAQGTREYTGTLITRAGNIRYEHDQAGRIVLRQHARLSRKPDTWRYQWDAYNRLTTVTTPDGTLWQYTYDPIGRRIAKQRLRPDGEVAEHTSFTWDGSVLAEQTTSGANDPSSRQVTTWDYQPGTFTPVTQGERWLSVAQDQVDERFYAIVTDLIGIPAELVGHDGDLVGHQQHSLWGTTYWSGASTPLRFPGQYEDPETGLHYNHHRFYDPATGRYLTPDPLGLIPAPNPHAYVANPYGAIDPLGLAPYEDAPTRQLKPTHSIRGDSSTKNVARLRDAMKDGSFDWQRSPISVVRDEDGELYVVDGHHRLAAAKIAGLDQVRVNDVTKELQEGGYLGWRNIEEVREGAQSFTGNKLNPWKLR